MDRSNLLVYSRVRDCEKDVPVVDMDWPMASTSYVHGSVPLYGHKPYAGFKDIIQGQSDRAQELESDPATFQFLEGTFPPRNLSARDKLTAETWALIFATGILDTINTLVMHEKEYEEVLEFDPYWALAPPMKHTSPDLSYDRLNKWKHHIFHATAKAATANFQLESRKTSIPVQLPLAPNITTQLWIQMAGSSSLPDSVHKHLASASLCLHLILQGHWNLRDDIKELLALEGGKPLEDHPLVEKKLRDIYTRARGARSMKIPLPLYYCLAFSPIVLFRDEMNLLKTQLKFEYLQQFWIHTRLHRRPSIILELERTIWRHLYNVACGVSRIDDIDAIHTISSVIDAEPSELNYFKDIWDALEGYPRPSTNVAAKRTFAPASTSQKRTRSSVQRRTSVPLKNLVQPKSSGQPRSSAPPKTSVSAPVRSRFTLSHVDIPNSSAPPTNTSISISSGPPRQTRKQAAQAILKGASVGLPSPDPSSSERDENPQPHPSAMEEEEASNHDDLTSLSSLSDAEEAAVPTHKKVIAPTEPNQPGGQNPANEDKREAPRPAKRRPAGKQMVDPLLNKAMESPVPGAPLNAEQMDEDHDVAGSAKLLSKPPHELNPQSPMRPAARETSVPDYIVVEPLPESFLHPPLPSPSKSTRAVSSLVGDENIDTTLGTLKMPIPIDDLSDSECIETWTRSILRLNKRAQRNKERDELNQLRAENEALKRLHEADMSAWKEKFDSVAQQLAVVREEKRTDNERSSQEYQTLRARYDRMKVAMMDGIRNINGIQEGDAGSDDEESCSESSTSPEQTYSLRVATWGTLRSNSKRPRSTEPEAPTGHIAKKTKPVV